MSKLVFIQPCIHYELIVLLFESYLGVFDLKSCYFHIRIHPDYTKYFGVKMQMEEGLTYMVYEYLPFGLSSAVHCVTKLWKPLIAYFQQQDVPISVYIDDGLFSASNQLLWNQRRNFIYSTLAKAGWTLATQKSDAEDSGSKSKQYLGFVINTQEMKLFLPALKSEQIRVLLQNFLLSSNVPAKALAKVLGKVISCISSHGPYARVCTRSGYADLQASVDARGWGASVVLSDSTKRELDLFLSILGPQNGHPFAHHLTDIKVETIFANPVSKTDTIMRPRKVHNAVVVSDASDFKVACKWLEGPHEGDISFTLTSSERCVSSGQRELLAMLKSLHHFKEVLHLTNTNFIWATDSENLVTFIKKGSPKEQIHALIMEVYQLCHEMKCTIEPVHLRRSDDRIMEVDELSKVKDTDNWSIDTFSFNQLRDEFGLTLDVFADAGNKRLPAFMSKNFESGTMAVDAFSAPWHGVVWLCPPH